jgi:iron complex transport system substrate-binding protein
MPGPGSFIHPRSRCAGAVWLALLCLTAACSSPRPATNQAHRRSFTDGLGRTVAVAPNPQRIISLAPSLTETLFALGVGDRLVGVTAFCDFPAEAQTKERVGDTMRPNLERIIALKPELVLVSTSSQLENLFRQLNELGVPVYVTDPRTVREIILSIRQLGEITGATARGEEVATEMEQRLAEVRRLVKDRPRPRVLYVLQLGPLITAGRHTFINDLITLAGGDSISATESADYPQFSRETIIARAPEVIVSSESHGHALVNLDQLRRDFAITPAVRQGRVELVNTDLVDRPGPRIIAGLEAVMRALHPELRHRTDER